MNRVVVSVNKALRKVHLKPGVNFINVLRAAFTLADPESTKKTVKLCSFFPLLGSAGVKAACRTLVKLTPEGDNPIKRNLVFKRFN